VAGRRKGESVASEIGDYVDIGRLCWLSSASSIDTILPAATIVEFDQRSAEYQMIRIDNGTRISHLVLFVQDDDGVWRVKFY
jgi:hypothetical protein